MSLAYAPLTAWLAFLVFCSYYEWRTIDGKKQPYFIYFPQQTSDSFDGLDINKNDDIKIEPKDVDIQECEASDLKGE